MNNFFRRLLLCTVALVYVPCTYSFKRIDLFAVDIQKQLLIKTIEHDARTRTYLVGGLCAAATAGLVAYGVYHAYCGTSTLSCPSTTNLITLENLQKRIVSLEAFQKRMTGEPGSNRTWTWIKSMGYHLFWILGPMLAVEAIKGSLLRAEAYVSAVFYTPSIEWAVHYQAHLGKLVKAHDVSDLPTETLLPGYLMLELINSADICKAHAKDNELSKLARTRFEEAWTTILHALEITIAYMHLRIDERGPEPNGAFSLLDRADRLTKYINELSKQLEQILEHQDEYTTLPDVVRRFRSELERHLIAFKYLETNTVCPYLKPQ